MKQPVRAMGIPTAASEDDVRQLISSKLEEQGREPMNIQVVLKEVEGGTCTYMYMYLSLQDEDGGYLEAAPAPPDELPDEISGEKGSVDGGSGDEESARLREALAKSEEGNTALQHPHYQRWGHYLTTLRNCPILLRLPDTNRKGECLISACAQ